jgi:hypothetical protein
MKVICYKWGECDVLWKNANWRWSECQLVDEIIGGIRPGVPGDLVQPQWLQEPKTEEDKRKRKRFIRLICKVKGYPEFDEKKEVRENIKITIEDIRLVVRAVKGIDIQVIEE